MKLSSLDPLSVAIHKENKIVSSQVQFSYSSFFKPCTSREPASASMTAPKVKIM